MTYTFDQIKNSWSWTVMIVYRSYGNFENKQSRNHYYLAALPTRRITQSYLSSPAWQKRSYCPSTIKREYLFRQLGLVQPRFNHTLYFAKRNLL